MAEWALLSRFLLSGIKHNKKPWPERDPGWSIRKEWIYITSGDRTVSRSICLCGSAGSFMSRVSLRFSEMSWFVERLLYEGDLRLEMVSSHYCINNHSLPVSKISTSLWRGKADSSVITFLGDMTDNDNLWFWAFFFFFMVIGMALRALYMLAKHFITKQYLLP